MQHKRKCNFQRLWLRDWNLQKLLGFTCFSLGKSVFAKAGKLNLLQGYADGTIRPNQAITRGEVAYLFNQLLQMTSPTAQSTYKAAFDDVPESLWSASAI